MRHSIRKQFAFIFIGLMTGTILLCWFINTIFLEKYYIHNKGKILLEARTSIMQAANSDEYGSVTFVKYLNEVCLISNIEVCVMDANSQTKYESVNSGSDLERILIGHIFGFDESASKIIEQGEDYSLLQMATESREYLILYGQIDTGISFALRTPIESIRESTKVANRFFAYAGIGGTIAGAFIIWLVTGRMLKPVKALNEISEQMVDLNFEVKYQGKEQNEIGMLGQNMNSLSAALEKAISELKTANIELQNDLDRKNKAEDMRKEFLANVSHELKTPIALIGGYAEGLLEDVNNDPDSRKYYCEVIADEAAKMDLLVQKLMTLNQLEFGQETVNMERFDLASMIRNGIQSVAVLTEKNGINVSLECADELYAWGDCFMVEGVFMNYLSNAIHYCEGKKDIVIRVENEGEKVKVSVFNTGKPIPEDSLSQVWDKFYKVDKARTREYGGSGVGLSIVKASMEAMNQAYGVENYENGVLFWFELDGKN